MAILGKSDPAGGVKSAHALPPGAIAPSPSVTDKEGFDRGTGTGEPSAAVARLLQLMKSADDGYNARDFDTFLGKLHSADVEVHQIGAPTTFGRLRHGADMNMWIAAFPDMIVHNNPYDIQFGQGEWTVAIGKLSGTFTGILTLPDGTEIKPTGKPFLTFFTTIARWQQDAMVNEYVLFDQQDIMKQIGVAPPSAH